jgi:cytoplasmic FMR1 interacting protein
VHSTNSVEADSFLEQYGDAVAWGGCTILYLLGQQLRFELLDFTYHVLAVAEAEALLLSTASLAEKSKSGHHTLVIQKLQFQRSVENGVYVRQHFLQTIY